ncbi:CENP-Q, a CENPA-CAD centromere complex subunit-domain-containing protein [Hypoxylon argillaceum]|nr:CENP-Q, a CENPA-CAD centromere complex subunit-domain-containing protein [Hypoxylon argillaceum]
MLQRVVPPRANADSREDPPLAANQKRKRGRPTNASRDDDNEVKDASNSSTAVVSQINQPRVDDNIDEGAMDEGSRPRKRGRRTADDNIPQEPQPELSETRPSKRRQRQPPIVQTEDSSVAQAIESAPSGERNMSKRGRPRRAGQQAKLPAPEAEEADDENENEGNSSLLRRSKRHRRSSDESPVISENHSIHGEETVSSKSKRTAKGRKRPIQLVNQEQPEEEAEPTPEIEITSKAQKRKSKKPRSSQDAQPPRDEAEPEPVLPPKKRGRPAKPGDGNRNSSTGIQNRSSKRRKEPANEQQQQAEGRRAQSSTVRRKSAGRRRSAEGQDESPARSSSPDSDSSPPPYRHIAKRTRRVTHEVIEAKWSSLDPLSIANIASLLHSVSLPTLLHVVPKQHAHAEDVLEKVIRGLRKRSARLPFPPASSLPRREDELDFERTQSAVEVLISQLDPLQHSVELLKREKERAEKDLEREYKTLDRLSSNARAEAREWRDRLRKVHVLVPEATYSSVTNNIDLLPADKATGQVFASNGDEELLNLAAQINNHMESMRGNLRQIDGIVPAIAKSHALLRTTLQPQFDQKQLENIMLGQVPP